MSFPESLKLDFRSANAPEPQPPHENVRLDQMRAPRLARMPSATVTNRTMVIPSSISSWPCWFRLCLIGVLVRCLAVWHSGSYSKGCVLSTRKWMLARASSKTVRYRGRQPGGRVECPGRGGPTSHMAHALPAIVDEFGGPNAPEPPRRPPVARSRSGRRIRRLPTALQDSTYRPPALSRAPFSAGGRFACWREYAARDPATAGC